MALLCLVRLFFSSLLLFEGYEHFVFGHGNQTQVDIANNQDVLDSLNHGLEEASGIFFVAASGCDEAKPGEHGNNHGYLDDDGVDVGVYAEDFEVFGFDRHPRFDGGVADGDGGEPHEESEDEQHEEGRLNNLPNHGDDNEIVPGCDFEGSVFKNFLLFNPVLDGVPDSAFEGYGMLVVVLTKACDVVPSGAPQQTRYTS